MVEARSQDSGFTPGFASRLRLADGRRVFVKAADDRSAWLLDAYRQEAAKLALIPAAVPAPRLQMVLDGPVEDRPWVVLVFDDVEGRPPERPWRPDEARLALGTARLLAEALTPPAGGPVLAATGGADLRRNARLVEPASTVRGGRHISTIWWRSPTGGPSC